MQGVQQDALHMDMKRVKDLTGQKFGRWVVVRFSHAKGNAAYWWCRCECEAHTEKSVFGGDLKRGESTSCGCLSREERAARSTKHSLSRHPAYRSWIYMRNRCNNPNYDGYGIYGGRGISVCERWNTSFEAFWEDMGPTWAPGLSIDRINYNDNYSPENCRWVTAKEQARNRRTETIIETPAGPMCVTEAAELYGLSRQTLFSRLRYKWTDPYDLVRPPHRK